MSQMRDRRPERRQRRSRSWGWSILGWRWVVPSIARGWGTGVVMWGIPLYIFFFLTLLSLVTPIFHGSVFDSSLMTDPTPFFVGAWIVKENKYTEGGGAEAAVRGITENWVGSGRIRGRGSIWALEGSCIPYPHFLHPTPTKNAIMSQLPLYPSHPLRNLKKLYLKLPFLWHQRLPPQLGHKLWRWPSLPTWHPFACCWGCQMGL